MFAVQSSECGMRNIKCLFLATSATLFTSKVEKQMFRVVRIVENVNLLVIETNCFSRDFASRLYINDCDKLIVMKMLK